MRHILSIEGDFRCGSFETAMDVSDTVLNGFISDINYEGINYFTSIFDVI